ncbi:MAG: flavodoxin family protein [Methanomassiliicoccales archaeon]|nr:MAG: flavodoxin family protein [Methanomassiliicoccales archaeon]
MMKVLGISGSPRLGGNSDLLLESALKGAKEAGAEVEKIRICELNISPCTECHGCDETGECIQEDDMQMLYPKPMEADRLFLASPIFFMGISAQLKAMIDRCQCIWVRKYKLNQTIGKGREHRKGFFMSVGGSKNPEKFVGAVKVVRSFFATLDITYEKELLVTGVDDKGAIKNHPSALKEALKIGGDMVSE